MKSISQLEYLIIGFVIGYQSDHVYADFQVVAIGIALLCSIYLFDFLVLEE